MQTVSHDVETMASPGRSFSLQTMPTVKTTIISRDLQNAIEQLRAVPSINMWEVRSIQKKHGNHHVSENELEQTNVGDVKRREVATLKIENGEVKENNTHVISDDATSQSNDTTETDSAADDSTDDRSKYSMSWNIRRLRKHRLEPTGYSKMDDNAVTSVAVETQSVVEDAPRKSRDRATSSLSYGVGSDESLDSVVERILESTDDVFEDGKRYRETASQPETETRVAKTDGAGVMDAVNVTLNVNRRHMVIVCDDRGKETAETHVDCESIHSRTYSEPTDSIQSDLLHDRVGQSEVTLEDLFEEAVESLNDRNEMILDGGNVGNVVQRKPTTVEKQYRGEENLERRIYDDDLHQHCHQYRLHGYSVISDTQYSRISRGFALVQKVDKTSSPLTTRRPPINDVENDVSKLDDVNISRQLDRQRTKLDDVNDVSKSGDKSNYDVDGRSTFRQRTVISASLAPSGGQSRRYNDDDDDDAEDYISKMNSDLDTELAVNAYVKAGHTNGGMSHASSITWDTISVDSLVMMDDENSTLRAIYSAKTSTSGATNAVPDRNAEYKFPDDEAVTLENNTEQLSNSRTVPSFSVTDLDDSRVNGKTNVETETKQQKQQPVSNTKSAETFSGQFSSQFPSNRSTNHIGDSQSTTGISSSNAAVVPRSDDVIVLADSITTQTLVLNVKLPKFIWNESRLRPRSAPCRHSPHNVPFRDLRLRREIQLADIHRTSGAISNFDNVTSVDNEKTKNDTSLDDVIAKTKTGDDSVIVFNSLRPSDLMTSLPINAEVKYENRQMTCSTELMHDNGADRNDAQLVGVERTEAVRELVVHGRQSADFRFEPTSLRRLIDNVKEALAVGGAMTSLGGAAVGITCEALETRSVDSCTVPPTVINDIVFDSMTSSMNT